MTLIEKNIFQPVSSPIECIWFYFCTFWFHHHSRLNYCQGQLQSRHCGIAGNDQLYITVTSYFDLTACFSVNISRYLLVKEMRKRGIFSSVNFVSFEGEERSSHVHIKLKSPKIHLFKGFYLFSRYPVEKTQTKN
jgi:hypothetical protein